MERDLEREYPKKSELIENLSQYLSQSIEQLKRDEYEYFEEYAVQLKYIAVEIAEKIIYQKISDDDMTMYKLVKNAVRSVRDVPWVKAEVSEQLSGYADSLEKELCEGVRMWKYQLTRTLRPTNVLLIRRKVLL